MSTSPKSRGRKQTRNPSTGRSKSPRTKGKSQSRSPSPQGSSSAIANGGKTDTEILEKAILKMFQKAGQEDDEDYSKSIKIPVFSDGTEWEAVVFELEVNLEKVWKYSSKMDIVDYLHGVPQRCDFKYIEKADKMIYYALVTAAKRDSFARKQIMASRHFDAVPRVQRNEGLKLFNLFQ